MSYEEQLDSYLNGENKDVIVGTNVKLDANYKKSGERKKSKEQTQEPTKEPSQDGEQANGTDKPKEQANLWEMQHWAALFEFHTPTVKDLP